MNFKKLLYQLQLEKDGTISAKNDYAIKALVRVESGYQVTTPDGEVIPGGRTVNIGGAKLEGQPVTTFDQFQTWAKDKGYTVSQADGREVSSGEPGAETLTEEEKSATEILKDPAAYRGIFRDYIKAGMSVDKAVQLRDYIISKLIEEDIKPGKLNSIIKEIDGTIIANAVAGEIFKPGKLKPKTEDQSQAEKDAEKEQEETLEQSLAKGTFNRIKAILYGNNPSFTRFCEEKIIEITAQLKEIAEKGKTKELRDLAKAELEYMERLSPETHRRITAESLGMSREQFVEALSRFEQVSVKIVKGKKVETKENPFDKDGKLLPGFRKNINSKQLAEHLLREKYADDPDLVESALRYANGGPFSLDSYINDYAESGSNPTQIKRDPKTAINVDAARIELLTESIITSTDGTNLSISDIISAEDKSNRRRYSKKALEEIERRLSASNGETSINTITLETTKTLLEKYIADGSQKYPPVEGSLSGERVFDILKELQEQVSPQTEIFSMLFSVASLDRGLFQKYENALSFSGNDDLVRLGLCSLSEMTRASRNITVLGWDGSKIHPDLYKQIEELLSSEQREVLDSLPSESLRHQYLSVQFSNDSYKFPITAISAMQAKMSTVFDLPIDAIVQMDEQEAEKERSKILEIKKSIPGAVYKAAYDFGNALLKNQDFDTALASFFEIIKENNPNITDEHLDKIKDFLEKTKKTSKNESAKIGAFAESAVYAVMALQSIPSGGSIDFSVSDGMNILSIYNSNGIPVLDFCDHGKNSGLCDMAIVPFKDGVPSCIVSSELKIYDKGKPEIASFKELLGFSKIINFYRSRTESRSIGFAGCQQEDMTNNGQQMNFDSGSGYTTITGDSNGYVKPSRNRS